MYSEGEQESVIALAADTGKTIWEHKYASPHAGLDLRIRRWTTLHAFAGWRSAFHRRLQRPTLRARQENRQGRLVSRSLERVWRNKDGPRLLVQSVAYKNTVILTLGGQGQTLIAFNQKDGKVAWKNQTLDMSPSSPIIINVDGQDQLIAFLGKVVAGIDPNNGNLLWSHPHVTEWGLNISMPVWGNDNLLFISSAYSGGSRVLRLTQKDGKTTA